MQILFYDLATPTLYDDMILRQQALGGTEATIIRVAHALKHYHTIYIAQHCCNNKDNHISDGVNYISLETAHVLSPDVVILLRQQHFLNTVADQFPKARHFFWMHNMPSRDFGAMREILQKHRYHIIAVSQFHRDSIAKRLEKPWYKRLFKSAQESVVPIHVIYNPIDNHLTKEDTCWNPNQLIFMSSPLKGLVETLKSFQELYKKFPHYQLLIAHPGYDKVDFEFPKQIRFLGALPHHQIIQHLRESFCVFYPQTTRLETFGLVYAEANAVGTPVLAHDAGAAREVLSDPIQLVQGHKISSVIAKMKEWREQRPLITGRDEFRLKNVVQEWLKLFD